MNRLLVVDDDIQMLSALEAALRRKGHMVETASNGFDAIVEAARSYEANIAAIGIVKTMINRTLDIGR